MKKILALTAAMLLIPFTAFGMQSLSVDEMAEITGQSGVAIALDDVKVFFTGGDETWYRTAANWEAISGEDQYYGASIGLISGGPTMMYANAMVPAALNGAVRAAQYGELESPGDRGLFVDYEMYAADPYDFNFGNTGRYGVISIAAANRVAGWGALLATTATCGVMADLPYIDTTWTALEAATAFNDGAGGIEIELNDVAFDSRALTIRVKDRLDTLSDATYIRLTSLSILNAVDQELAVVAAAGVDWAPRDGNWYTGSNYFSNFVTTSGVTHAQGFQLLAAGNAAAAALGYTDKNIIKIAGVEIGLPTVELYYQERSDLEILISTNPLPTTLSSRWRVQDYALGLVAYDDINTWSFGKLYFGGNSSTTILDGTIEITPIEAYANPTFFQATDTTMP